MNKFNKFALCALVLPVGSFTSGAAFAVADDLEPEQGQETTASKAHGGPMSERADGSVLEAVMPGDVKSATYMRSAPEDSVRVDEVVGTTLYMRGTEQEVAEIDDLILDRNGRVIAVVVDIGGLLGMGERTVAISWDSIERTLNEAGDGYRFSVNATETAIREAPTYDEASTGIRVTSAIR